MTTANFTLRVTAWLLLLPCACTGGGSTAPAPALDYGSEPLLLRAGEPLSVTPTSSRGALVITPPLPSGLAFDAATGAITGTPTTASARQSYQVAGQLAGQEITVTFELVIAAPLPSEIDYLAPGFTAERLAWLTEPPGKFAVAPDGRLLVTERSSGVIRVIAANGTLQTTPFATVPVTTGNHRGLLGIVLSPQFASDRHVFALATTPASGGSAERSTLYRFTDQDGIGVHAILLRDDLPVAQYNNGGALCFDRDGMLVVSLGDTQDPQLAQQDQMLAGKLLRLSPLDGTSAPGNPVPGSAVLAKGLRNVWALALEPTAGSLVAADNGPDSDDSLLLVQPGRNFAWGALPGQEFGPASGVRLRHWIDVVVPTGLAFAAPDSDWPEPWRRSLFLSLYDPETVLRIQLSGPLRTDIDREEEFLRFLPDGNHHKPLDLQRDAAGRIWLLTFAAIYRIDRIR